MSEKITPWVVVPAFDNRDWSRLRIAEKLMVIGLFLPAVFLSIFWAL